MSVWNFLINNLENKVAVTLLYVLDSNGSSPGRKGFKMAVNQDGIFEGTIGGGIMEVKMIELAKSKMDKANTQPLVKQQYHDKAHTRNQSGLICSGEQTIAILPLKQSDLEIIQKIVQSRPSPIFLKIDAQKGLQLDTTNSPEKRIIHSQEDFEVTFQINPLKTIHIFGAGHVGLALARQMSVLGFTVLQYDDRPNLPTLAKNEYATNLQIIDYERVGEFLKTNPIDIVVLVSFSYRSDKILLQQLYNQPFAYIGMMGSDHKIATLRKELANEGISAQDLSHVFMPIGLPIYSKTAPEIAVSIAGQIILELNRGLPTGRAY